MEWRSCSRGKSGEGGNGCVGIIRGIVAQPEALGRGIHVMSLKLHTRAALLHVRNPAATITHAFAHVWPLEGRLGALPTVSPADRARWQPCCPSPSTPPTRRCARLRRPASGQLVSKDRHCRRKYGHSVMQLTTTLVAPQASRRAAPQQQHAPSPRRGRARARWWPGV